MQDLVVADDRGTAVDSVAAKAIFGAADSNSRLALDVSIQLPNNGECKLSLEAHIDALAQGAKLMDADECSKLITPESEHEETAMSLRQALLAEHDSEANAANADAALCADAKVDASCGAEAEAASGADGDAASAADAKVSAAEAATGAVAAASADVEASSVGADAAALLAKAEAAIAKKQEAQAQKLSNKIKAAMKKVEAKDRHLCPMALRVKEIFAEQDSFGTAEAYDAVDAMVVKVPFAQRMCPEGYTLEQRSWTEEICAYRGQDIKADGSGGFLQSGLSRRAITMLTNSSDKIFANKDEAFNALLSVLTKPVIELMANRNVTTIALGTDTRVLYKGDDKVITVLPAVEQNNINLLARELVYLNVPERVHDMDISDVVGRVGLGGFYFKCDVPPHSKVPVVTMWRKSCAKLSDCTSDSNSLSAPIEANSSALKPEHYASPKDQAADIDSDDALSELSAADAQQDIAELDGAKLDSAEHADSSSVRVAYASYPQRAGIAVYPQTALSSQAGNHAHALSHELCSTSSVQMQAHHVLTSCESGDDDTEDVSTSQYSVPSASAPCQTHPNSACSTSPQTQVLSQVQVQTHMRPEPQLHSVACGSSDEIDDERDEWFDAEAMADAQTAAAEAAMAAAAQAASAEGSAVASDTAALSWIGQGPMGPVIEAAQDDPGVYAINDCRFDPQEQARKSISAAELRTMEYCGSDANKSAGTSPIATELGLDLRLSERAWKMMEKIDHKWRTGNYNIESLRMLTFLIGPVILELLANPEVTEIAVNSDRRLFVNTYTQRSVELKNSQSTYMDAMMRLLASMLDITLSPDKHILSGILPIDGSRVECNRPPVVPNPTLVIRKHSACSLTLDRLMDLDMLDLSQYIILEHALKERLSIIVSGETGSGKTTLLSALINQLADIYPRERVICLEDTPELQPQIANCTHAYTSDSTDMSELVRSALRQHPDRIVVGEVRGPEALDLLDALSTGHKGSFSSMHAGSPQEAVKRLGLMISRNPEAPENYNDLIVSALDLIIQMESRPSPHIRCIECITGIDANGITVMPLKSASELKRFQTRPDA